MIAPRPVERIREDHVDDDDHRERYERPIPGNLDLRLAVTTSLRMRAVSFARRLELPRAVADPTPADEQEEQRGEETDARRRPGRRLEIRGRDDVLDLRRTRQRDHREGKDAHPERRRQQTLRNIRLTEHIRAERIHDESDDENRKTAVRQHSAAEEHRKHCALLAEHLDDLARDRRRESALFHEAREDSAEQEHRIIRLHILRHTRHVELRIRRQDAERARERCNASEHRCNQDDRPAAIREIHEPKQGNCDTKSLHKPQVSPLNDKTRQNTKFRFSIPQKKERRFSPSGCPL